MENLILFFVSTIGLCNILVHGKILDEIKVFRKSVRDWMHSFEFTKELLSCYECTGWWSGLMVGTVIIQCADQSWLYLLIYPFAGSVVSAFYSELIFMIRSKTEFVMEDMENGPTKNDS